ncbi:hypothetical protein BKA70DRAFT_1530398 [Coprinopsis sp. MPI-PUGE-AT-0042]|nr:hypothetical protein BKA70DRAFT_1530398 [Coprinopsis sp. MPI-PUGE-AT-0042]
MITFFDLPCNAPNKVWSPNTWKTRLCLNYKGLPYKTEWVEFPDIRALYEKYNVPGNAKPDGSPEPYYSLPAILDVEPSTGKVIMVADSLKIAKYLDATYPDTPKVLPSIEDEKSIAEQEAFARRVLMALFPIFPNIFGSKVLKMGNEASQGYGSISSLDEVTFTEEEKKENFAKFLGAFDGPGAAIQDEGGKVAWASGDAISFSDFAIAGALYWVRASVGEDSQEWKMVAEWKGGKWVRFLNRLEPYATVA